MKLTLGLQNRRILLHFHCDSKKPYCSKFSIKIEAANYKIHLSNPKAFSLFANNRFQSSENTSDRFEIHATSVTKCTKNSTTFLDLLLLQSVPHF